MKKKVFAAALAAAMAFVVQIPAFAATNDPNLTAYETPYTTTVSAGIADTVYLMAVPANNSYLPTTFDSEADAAQVKWTVEPGSTEGVTVNEASIMGMDTGGTIAAYVEVDVAAGAAPGAASIKATNPETGAAMNFTVVVNGAAENQGDITYKYYEGNNKTPLLTVSKMEVAANDHYGNTQYPSVLDGIYKSWMNTMGEGDKLKAYDIQDPYNSGSYVVKSLTFEKNGEMLNYTEKVDETYNYYGWQYRVYRDGKKVPLSEMIGGDEFALKTGDTVVWRYGQYGVVDFAETL